MHWGTQEYQGEEIDRGRGAWQPDRGGERTLEKTVYTAILRSGRVQRGMG